MRSLILLCLCAATCAPPALAQSAPRAKKPTAAAVAQPSAEQLVEQARTQLQQGDNTQALTTAQEAQRRDPTDYKAAYYVAYALMTLKDYQGAQSAQKRSLELARSDEQATLVKALGDAIEARRGVEEADRASADGLHAKAARLYAAAFDAGLPEPDLGLKAARIYEQNLSELGSAARLLRAVTQKFPGSPAAQTASGELSRLQSTLHDRAEEKLRAALQQPAGRRKALLLEAAGYDPEDREIQVALLAEASAERSLDDFASRAKLLQQRGWLEDTLTSGDVAFEQWIDEPRLRTLLADMWGEDKVKAVLQVQVAKVAAAREKARLAEVARARELMRRTAQAHGEQARQNSQKIVGSIR
jgi:tetratricopeptide (TPR) repeat protein